MPPTNPPPQQPLPGGDTGTVSLAYEPVLHGFEQAWQKGERPDLDSHQAAVPPGRRLAALGDLVPLDLEYRLKAGEAARVEDYLRRYPDLAADADTVLDLATSTCGTPRAWPTRSARLWSWCPATRRSPR
jgi:hypothetical protein